MKFSERWLRTMVDPPIDTAALCEKLTMAGLEVEDAVPAAPPFSGVVVARIEKVDPHPNADRLRVCVVDIGAAERLQIVCGAPNAAAGMKVPCAASAPSCRAGSPSRGPPCAASSRRECSARRRSSASTTTRRDC